MKLLARVLLGWGIAVLSIVYILASTGAALDAYTRSGWGGVIIVLILVSIVPSIVAGVILLDRVGQ